MNIRPSTAFNTGRLSFFKGSRLLGLLVAAATLAGCDSEEQKRPASQVVAKVNQEELSVHQVNFLLGRLGQVPAGKEGEAKKKVVDRLVEQELLVQKAVETKIDRDPAVMMALDAARREVIAQAYLEKTVGTPQKPTPQQVSAYYTQHPELFAERKIYRLRELAIATTTEAQLTAVKAMVAKGVSLDDMIAWATSENIPYRPMIGVKPAEQLPLEHLPRLHALKDGQVASIEGPSGLLAIQVLATKKQPIDEKTATPVIEQYLQADARRQMAATEMTRLRSAAKIEYVGEFANAAAAAPAAATAQTPMSGDAQSISQGIKGIR